MSCFRISIIPKRLELKAPKQKLKIPKFANSLDPDVVNHNDLDPHCLDSAYNKLRQNFFFMLFNEL